MIAELEFSFAGLIGEFTVIDIDADPQLVEIYGIDVPVLMIDGEEVCRHRLDIVKLRDKLSEQT